MHKGFLGLGKIFTIDTRWDMTNFDLNSGLLIVTKRDMVIWLGKQDIIPLEGTGGDMTF